MPVQPANIDNSSCVSPKLSAAAAAQQKRLFPIKEKKKSSDTGASGSNVRPCENEVQALANMVYALSTSSLTSRQEEMQVLASDVLRPRQPSQARGKSRPNFKRESGTQQVQCHPIQ